MPDKYIPQLEDAWRKDLVDLYNNGEEAKLQNMLRGFSVLKKLTPDYLLLQTTERSTIEMKLFPLVNNTHVVCVVTTVDGPVPDSEIEFYSTDWEPLTTSDLFTPSPSSWFIKEDINKEDYRYIDAISKLDIELIKYQLSPDSLTLSATLTTPQYLSKEDQKNISLYIKPEPKIYTWDKYHFK